MKLRYVIYGLLLIGLFLFAIWEQMTPTAGQKGFLRIVRNLTPLKKIIIQPYPFSPAKWEIVVTNVADLAQVHKALQQADLKPVSGHSGEIFESVITFVASDERIIKTRATVHKYEPDDLYLSPVLFQETKPRVFVVAGIPDRIRVPKLGTWAMNKTNSGNPKIQ